MGNEDLKTKTKAIRPEAKNAPVYEAVVGMNYGCTDDNPNGVRVEAGEIVPNTVIEKSPWLMENSHVRFRKEVA